MTEEQAEDICITAMVKGHSGQATTSKKFFKAVRVLNMSDARKLYESLSDEFVRKGIASNRFSELEQLFKIAEVSLVDYDDKNKELDQLEKRLEKYEEKAQRDDKKICDMGFKLHEVNERLKECEEKLKALNFYCSEYGLKEESFAILMACEKACEYFKKYEGKDVR